MRNAEVNVKNMEKLLSPCVTLKEAMIKIAQYIPNNHAQSPQLSPIPQSRNQNANFANFPM